MFNATIVGNLGADPELRYTSSGDESASLRVAVNQRLRQADGSYADQAEWVTVRVMGRQLEYVKKLSKGTRVVVVGAVTVTRFTRRDGSKDAGLDVFCSDITAVSPSDRSAGQAANGSTAAAGGAVVGALDDDDLPL